MKSRGALLLLALAGGAASCTDSAPQGGPYTPPSLPSSTIGRLRPDANLRPGQQ